MNAGTERQGGAVHQQSWWAYLRSSALICGSTAASGRPGCVELMPLAAGGIVIMSPTQAAEPRVPVTAKLSKRFYDVLREDIANELVDWFSAMDLTYRTDLPELNELNFARFVAKLEQRLAEFRSELLGWMFGFWVTTLLGIAGLMVALR
jgi:hypothetical protein